MSIKSRIFTNFLQNFLLLWVRYHEIGYNTLIHFLQFRLTYHVIDFKFSISSLGYSHYKLCTIIYFRPCLAKKDRRMFKNILQNLGNNIVILIVRYSQPCKICDKLFKIILSTLWQKVIKECL